MTWNTINPSMALNDRQFIAMPGYRKHNLTGSSGKQYQVVVKIYPVQVAGISPTHNVRSCKKVVLSSTHSQQLQSYPDWRLTWAVHWRGLEIHSSYTHHGWKGANAKVFKPPKSILSCIIAGSHPLKSESWPQHYQLIIQPILTGGPETLMKFSQLNASCAAARKCHWNDSHRQMTCGDSKAHVS